MRNKLLLVLVLMGATFGWSDSIYEDDYIQKMKGIKTVVDTGIPNKIKASRLKDGTHRQILRFAPILFDGKSMTSVSKRRLDDIVSLINTKDRSSYYISLLGHTSSHLSKSHEIKRDSWSAFWQRMGGEDMSEEESVSLANSRIRTVYDVLKGNRVHQSSIYTENRLSRDKLSTEASAEGLALNNRVDIVLYLNANINLHIKFKLDSSIIRSYYKKRVHSFARFLKDNPDYSAMIIGHTDKQASYNYNIKLSKRRANATKKMLVSLGVNPRQLRTSGKGYTQPLDRRSNKEAYRKNRRIEARLIDNR